MLRFVLRRLTLMVPVLVGLSLLLFAWVRALPGDPARALLGERATPDGIARVNAAYGFDQPLFVQYFTYVKALLHGDFGSSIQTGRPVMDSFLERFPATIELGLAALLLAVVVGVPLGYLAARHQGRALDTAVVVRLAARGGHPGVLPGDPAQARLRRHPALAADRAAAEPAHRGHAHHQLLRAGRADDPRVGRRLGRGLCTWSCPAIALGTIPLAIIVRITRASVAEVMHEDYVRTAESKGLTSAVISPAAHPAERTAAGGHHDRAPGGAAVLRGGADRDRLRVQRDRPEPLRRHRSTATTPSCRASSCSSRSCTRWSTCWSTSPTA